MDENVTFCNFFVDTGKARCTVKNTILFVAFDFEELTAECTISPYLCGSNRFVKNITSYLKETGGIISGAIILDTILNHDFSPGITCDAKVRSYCLSSYANFHILVPRFELGPNK